LGYHPDVLVEQRSVRVSAFALLLEPEPRLAERRAGRPPNDQHWLSSAKSCAREDLLRRHFSNVAGQRGGVREVRGESLECWLVVVGGDIDAKQTVSRVARGERLRVASVDREVKSARAREQAHYRELLGHLSPQSARDAPITEHRDCRVKQVS